MNVHNHHEDSDLNNIDQANSELSTNRSGFTHPVIGLGDFQMFIPDEPDQKIEFNIQTKTSTQLHLNNHTNHSPITHTLVQTSGYFAKTKTLSREIYPLEEQVIDTLRRMNHNLHKNKNNNHNTVNKNYKNKNK